MEEYKALAETALIFCAIITVLGVIGLILFALLKNAEHKVHVEQRKLAETLRAQIIMLKIYKDMLILHNQRKENDKTLRQE